MDAPAKAVVAIFLATIVASVAAFNTCAIPKGECNKEQFVSCSDRGSAVQPESSVWTPVDPVKLCSDPALMFDAAIIQQQISPSTKISCAAKCNNRDSTYVVCVNVSNKEGWVFWVPIMQQFKITPASDKLRAAIAARLGMSEARKETMCV